MRGDIVSNTVAAGSLCDCCNRPASCVVQGETDSFGYERVLLCPDCHEEQSQLYTGEDIEDRAPQPDHIFVVSEQTNHDGRGSWFEGFDSYREAMVFYHEIERQAEPWQGLYPRKGVREWTIEEFQRTKAKQLAALRREMAWMDELDAEEALREEQEAVFMSAWDDD